MSQEIGFFDRIRTGELMNRLSEVEHICSAQSLRGTSCMQPYFELQIMQLQRSWFMQSEMSQKAKQAMLGGFSDIT